jgi:alpha-L-fucosidase
MYSVDRQENRFGDSVPEASGSPIAPRKIRSVRMRGSKAHLKWTQNVDGLTVDFPAEKPCDYAFALEITPAQ